MRCTSRLRLGFSSRGAVLLLGAGVLLACSASPERSVPAAPPQAAPPVAGGGSSTSALPRAPERVGPAENGRRPVDAEAAPPTSVVAHTTFLAVGDILLSRRVAACIAEREDPGAPFRGVADLFASVDFSFGNLESPFSTSDRFSISSANVFNTPRAHVRGLVDNRFRVVNLANNHILDQGVAGLRTTLSHLAAHDIATVGAGLDQQAAWRPIVVDSKGVRVGFVGASYASVNDDGATRSPFVARLDHRQALATALDELRGQADLLVVTMHAGAEYNPQVRASQVEFAHAAVELGADVVFGAHPHVLQRVERYRGRYIFYSLGNFIFDHIRPGTRQGLAVQTRAEVRVDRHGARHGTITSLRLHPVVIEARCAPRPATETEAEQVLGQVGVAAAVLPL